MFPDKEIKVKMRKILCTILAATIGLSLFGCNTSGLGGGGGGKNGGITVSCFEAGFGTEWLVDMAKQFEALTKIKVNVKRSYIQGELNNMVASGDSTSDVVMSLGSFFSGQDTNRLVDLSDVYDSVPLGAEVSVKEKMNKEIYEKLQTPDGKIYQMNWANSISSFLYNKTVLDKALGEDNYTIPRTTDEMVALCDRIKSTDVYPIAASVVTGYWDYAHLAWWAQYSGYEAYNDYYKGYYTKMVDGEKVRTVADAAQVCDDPGRLESLTVASKFLNSRNGYMHTYSNAMDFNEAQIAFVSQGYGDDNKESAFLVCGDWFSNEMQSYLIRKPQDIRLMKMPIISSIVKTLENKSMTDAQLSAAIKAIDEGATEVVAGVSENDFLRLKEARQITYSATIDHGAVIPVTSKKQPMAKDFLKYLASPYAGAIYADHLNGLTLPYGYGAAEGTTATPYIKSRNELFNNYKPIYLDYSSPLVYRGGFGAYSVNNAVLDKPLYDGTTPQSIISTTKTTYLGRWDDILFKGGLKK